MPKLGTSILKNPKQELLRKQFDSSESGVFPKEKSKLHVFFCIKTWIIWNCTTRFAICTLWTRLTGISFGARPKQKTLGPLPNLKNFGFYSILWENRRHNYASKLWFCILTCLHCFHQHIRLPVSLSHKDVF